MMDILEQVTQLKKALNISRYTIAITGAGISFSAGGMNFDHENVDELMPLASEDVLRNEPDKYYKLLDHAFLHSMFANEPSYAHKALRSLEIDGRLQGTIPRCDECGDVIWTFPFYSHVGLHEENLKKAQDWISKADLILIIGANGSYGNTYFNYRKRGARVIQINPSETNFDVYSAMNIRAGADEVFQLII